LVGSDPGNISIPRSVLHPGKEIILLEIGVILEILGELGSGRKLLGIAPKRVYVHGLERVLAH
jgi:hypothetical protein